LCTRFYNKSISEWRLCVAQNRSEHSSRIKRNYCRIEFQHSMFKNMCMLPIFISLFFSNYVGSTLFILINSTLTLHTAYTLSISSNTVGVSQLQFHYCLSHFMMQTQLSQFRRRSKICVISYPALLLKISIYWK
jgi:hypothetical protein